MKYNILKKDDLMIYFREWKDPKNHQRRKYFPCERCNGIYQQRLKIYRKAPLLTHCRLPKSVNELVPNRIRNL